MMKDKYQKLYAEAGRIIGDKTPLKKDCGQICDGACCKGDDDTGMLLFPFEESVLHVEETRGYALQCVRADATEVSARFPAGFFLSSHMSHPMAKLRLYPISEV